MAWVGRRARSVVAHAGADGEREGAHAEAGARAEIIDVVRIFVAHGIALGNHEVDLILGRPSEHLDRDVSP